jgi:hypothetical protein
MSLGKTFSPALPDEDLKQHLRVLQGLASLNEDDDVIGATTWSVDRIIASTAVIFRKVYSRDAVRSSLILLQALSVVTETTLPEYYHISQSGLSILRQLGRLAENEEQFRQFTRPSYSPSGFGELQEATRAFA